MISPNDVVFNQTYKKRVDKLMVAHVTAAVNEAVNMSLGAVHSVLVGHNQSHLMTEIVDKVQEAFGKRNGETDV